MKEIKVNGLTVKLKKEYLTNGEVNYIISKVMDYYREDGDINNYDYSPLSMVTNFYALLFSMVIDGYDIDSTEMYNEYYNAGVHTELLRIIINAEEAYHLMMSTSKDVCSIEYVIDKNMNKLISSIMERVPDSKALTKLANKLPKEWQTVVGQYAQITGEKSTQEEDK